eukprot:scaffold270559_cov29-Tisochrysis_lutea.AAC.3
MRRTPTFSSRWRTCRGESAPGQCTSTRVSPDLHPSTQGSSRAMNCGGAETASKARRPPAVSRHAEGQGSGVRG